MTNKMQFSTGALYSAGNGALVTSMDDIYEVAQFLTGGPVWTRTNWS